MKPAWDKLMKKYNGHDSIVIADVDCTAGGKALCNTIGVKGYPTLKYGDPASLEKYEGGRTYKDLEVFAATLKPSCSPNNIDLCDDVQRKEIEDIQNMPEDELKADIRKGEKAIKDAEKHFEKELENLQATFKKLQADKEKTEAAVKGDGLSMKKAVRAAQLKAAKAKEAVKEEL